MRRLLNRLLGSARLPLMKSNLTAQQYWTGYNVTQHKQFTSSEESLRYFDWRSSQYYDYLNYMPVSGFGGKAVLDYGCGPGHDMVGFAHYSNPARLVGADVSQPSLNQARARLALHGKNAEFLAIDENSSQVPLESGSFDHIHCSGVLHHTPDPLKILREFRRLLKPSGEVRLMIYNYDSLWLHLFSAYTMRQKRRGLRNLDVRDIFKMTTDGLECPISHAWSADDVAGMAQSCGLVSEHLGNATSVREIQTLPSRFEAILDPEFAPQHRHFLLELTFDARGVPYYRGKAAGIDGCYRLRIA